MLDQEGMLYQKYIIIATMLYQEYMFKHDKLRMYYGMNDA